MVECVAYFTEFDSFFFLRTVGTLIEWCGVYLQNTRRPGNQM